MSLTENKLPKKLTCGNSRKCFTTCKTMNEVFVKSLAVHLSGGDMV